MNLVISTLEKDDNELIRIINKLKEKLVDVEIIYTDEMNIKGCIGCNHCWLKTPGTCSIKDDYEKILLKYLEADQVFFITEAKLGFISHKLKNVIDRMLPLATMYLKFNNNQMRHTLRYPKLFKMGLIYVGDGNKEFLSHWFERVVLNFEGESLGIYESEEYLK